MSVKQKKVDCSICLFHHDCRRRRIALFITPRRKKRDYDAAIIIINCKSFQFACFGGPTQTKTCKVFKDVIKNKIFFCTSHDYFANIGSKLINKSNY